MKGQIVYSALNDEIVNSSILKLEKLQKQFSLAMNQYKKSLASYNNELKNPNSKMANMYLQQTKDTNSTLTSLHGQILSALKEVNPSYQRLVTENHIESKILKKTYENLTKENEKIKKLLAKFNSLEHVKNDSSLKIDSNYSHYRILIIVVIILIFFFSKQILYSMTSSLGMTGGGSAMSLNRDLLFNFILMILLLFLANAFQHSAAYILWGLFVLAYIILKNKTLFSFK